MLPPDDARSRVGRSARSPPLPDPRFLVLGCRGPLLFPARPMARPSDAPGPRPPPGRTRARIARGCVVGSVREAEAAFHLPDAAHREMAGGRGLAAARARKPLDPSQRDGVQRPEVKQKASEQGLGSKPSGEASKPKVKPKIKAHEDKNRPVRAARGSPAA